MDDGRAATANRAVSADHRIETLRGNQDLAGAVKRLQVGLARDGGPGRAVASASGATRLVAMRGRCLRVRMGASVWIALGDPGVGWL